MNQKKLLDSLISGLYGREPLLIIDRAELHHHYYTTSNSCAKGGSPINTSVIYYTPSRLPTLPRLAQDALIIFAPDARNETQCLTPESGPRSRTRSNLARSGVAQ